MFYPDFYRAYIKLVEEMPLLEALQQNANAAGSFYSQLPANKWLHRYAANKWTIKEILGHIIDTERIMNHRALRFARKDNTELPGYDHEAYVKNADYNNQPPEKIMEEFNLVRQLTILQFSNFEYEVLQRSGKASQGRFTVEALGYVIAGHELIHRNTIREKYL